MSVRQLVRYASYFRTRLDGDFVDSANSVWTSNALLIFCTLSALKQFYDDPIECMTPINFGDTWQAYTENYCWSQDSYFVRPEVDVELIDVRDRYSESRRLSYYQWVPFLLLLQAACFRLPSFLWKCGCMNSGIRVHEIVERACDSQNVEDTTLKKTLESLTQHITKALHFQRRMARKNVLLHRTVKLLNLRYKACFISYLYLLTKFAYLVNVCVQFYFMNWFLHTDRYTWYGFSVIYDILTGVQWESSGYFPRVSICDFTIRQVANIQKYSVQCVLVINIFNEKIFILLWFWYVILAFCTIVSFFYWAVLMLFSSLGCNFIKSNLELCDLEIDTKKEKKELDLFVTDYLKMDGVFILRMVAMHAGIIFGSDLIGNLYKVYHNIQDPGSPYPVPSYYEANLAAAGLRKRKKSKQSMDVGDEEEDVAMLVMARDRRDREEDRQRNDVGSDPNSNSTGFADTTGDDKKSEHSNTFV